MKIPFIKILRIYIKAFRAWSSPFKEKEMSVIWFATWLRFVRELEILDIQRKLFL